jgi:hypothetical protein
MLVINDIQVEKQTISNNEIFITKYWFSRLLINLFNM